MFNVHVILHAANPDGRQSPAKATNLVCRVNYELAYEMDYPMELNLKQGRKLKPH
jgi:hypothetical protein